MESSLRGHAAAFQQQQQLQFQNQQFQQQQQYYRQRSGIHPSGASSVASSMAMSVGSHYSRDSQGSNASSQVDEAYRKLGRRLSVRAHGDGPSIQPKSLTHIGLTPTSIFTSYGGKDFTQEKDEDRKDDQDGTGTFLNRTAKVAKTRYSDHGDHHHQHMPSSNGNVVRKMTLGAAELFRLWHSDAEASVVRRSKKRSSPTNVQNKSRSKSEKGNNHINPVVTTDLSPQRFAFSQLALDGSSVPVSNKQQQEVDPYDKLPENLLSIEREIKPSGLLSAVMEQSSNTSGSTTPHSGDTGKSSMTSSQTRTTISSLKTLPPGKCLTQPSEPASNNGKDNAEGNLIVHVNNAISVSRKQIHVLTKDKMKNVRRADFRIQSLLGQGTFAQVFQCVHVQTGNLVAIKIVKNKPAYTRQAAVEIDVFRALNKSNTDKSVGSSHSVTSTDDNSVASATTSKWDYMVDLVCYFMHQKHLCLVFELLGLNLYEVLKKRQFRGLPLSVVKTLLKQAVFGVKELSKKGVVHCDLKPENILLVNEDDVDSVVSAGESRHHRRTSNVSKGSPSSVNKTRKEGSDSLEKKQSLEEPPQTVEKVVDRNPAMTPQTDAISQSPANSMATGMTNGTNGHALATQNIKLIDFGSACFEGQTAHTYIQSRFYRSPEVLVGLPYDSAIDMWSLGCVAAELFLGLPILPGVHEHDQLGRICEMISSPADWMLDQGSKSSKYFIKHVNRESPHAATPTTVSSGASSDVAMTSRSPRKWRLKTQQEFISSLSQSEIRKKGGLAKLQKQPANRYFKRKRLSEIIIHKGQSGTPEDKEHLELFIHFLYGILDPDPWKRWTAVQAAQHPFLVGGSITRKTDEVFGGGGTKDENQANMFCDIVWEAPWDPNVCRRKLLNVQKIRDKQASRRSFSNRHVPSRPSSSSSNDGSADRMQESPTGNGQGIISVQQNAMQGIGGGVSNQHSIAKPHNQHAYPMSSSFSESLNIPVVSSNTSSGNSSNMSAMLPYPSGPLSYSEAGYAPPLNLAESFNEVDFAYALQRPGVIPMGESMTSSNADLSGAGIQGSLQQHQMVGAYGSNNRSHRAPTQRRPSATEMSRSHGEMVDRTTERRESLNMQANSLASAPEYMNDQIPPSPSHIQPSNSVGSQVPSAVSQQFPLSLNYQVNGAIGHPEAFGGPGIAGAGNMIGQQSFSSQGMQDPSLQAIESSRQQELNPMVGMQQQLAYGNAQAYLQQQHAALQQQQLLLQQQQAALALQQQQLQAYGINPTMVSGGANTSAVLGQIGAPMPAFNQFAQANGGYFVVAAADGTPMMVPAGGIPQTGVGYGMPQQGPGFGGMYPNGVPQNGGMDNRFNPADPSRYTR